MGIGSIDGILEANNVLRHYYNKMVPFSVADDAKIVNAENVTATFIIRESCFPFTGYDVISYRITKMLEYTYDHM